MRGFKDELTIPAISRKAFIIPRTNRNRLCYIFLEMK